MAGIATNATDDVGGEVSLLRTVILPVTDLTTCKVSTIHVKVKSSLTVLTRLVLVISKGTVESCQFSQLVSLEFVLAFWNRCCSLDDVMDQLFCFVDLLFSICHDQAVEIFFLVASVSCVRSSFSFFDRALATNGNLGE